MKSHDAANCRVNPKRYNNPSAMNPTATAKRSSTATNSAFDKLTKAVNQITAAVAPIIKDYKQQGIKSKKVKVDKNIIAYMSMKQVMMRIDFYMNPQR